MFNITEHMINEIVETVVFDRLTVKETFSLLTEHEEDFENKDFENLKRKALHMAILNELKAPVATDKVAKAVLEAAEDVEDIMVFDQTENNLSILIGINIRMFNNSVNSEN